MTESENIKNVVRAYILENLLDEASTGQLTNSTGLVTGGILDSEAPLQMISSLETEFNIESLPQEVDQDNLNTIDRIAEFVQSKMG